MQSQKQALSSLHAVNFVYQCTSGLSHISAVVGESPSSDSTPSSGSTVSSALVAAAGQAADDDVEEGNDAVDDGHADAADAVDNRHDDVADGLADALQLWSLLVKRG